MINVNGGAKVASAHSGGMDANGGHYQHTTACRNSGYNHTSACTYHYHNSGNGYGGTTNTNPNNGYTIPKPSDAEMKAMVEKYLKQLEAQNKNRNTYGPSVASTATSNDSGDGWVPIAIIGGIVLVCLVGRAIYKKVKA